MFTNVGVSLTGRDIYKQLSKCWQEPITRRSVQRCVNQPFAKNLLSAMTKYGSTCLPPTNHM